MRTAAAFLFIILFVEVSNGQQKKAIANKLSPYLHERRSDFNNGHQQVFYIVSPDLKALKQFLAEKQLHSSIVSEYSHSGLLVLKTTRKVIDSFILSSDLVTFVDVQKTPYEETVINGFDKSTNKITTAHDEYPSINGKDLVVSIKENKPDSNDIDLKSRFVSSDLSSLQVTSHATIMSTIVAGGGNSYYTGKGAAWGARITSSNFAILLPDADQIYRQYDISVQNHSYGTGIENYYGADAAAYDASTLSNPSLLHIFSAGNTGDKTSTSGTYSGIPHFANLTGSFKMAKNIIIVGAIDSFYNIPVLSSRGPAHDGRVKPELVAYAIDGSSGAAAIVSGISLLLQQAYRENNNGQLPPSALVKSILLNSADDTGPEGIDFLSGFGSVNALRAIQGMRLQNFFGGSIGNGATQTFNLDLPPATREVKITLCWNDTVAEPNNAKALRNDLDIELIYLPTGEAWLPWVLNSFPNVDSLNQLPRRKRDTLNNTEQITLDYPQAGNYIIRVKALNVGSAQQPYFISYQWDSLNTFKWLYPTGSDNLVSKENNTLRWASQFPINSGKLEYTMDKGTTWQLVSPNIELAKGYFRFAVPDIFSTVVFRMNINSESFTSEPCTVSKRIQLKVGFDCEDSLLLYWNKPPAVDSFSLFSLGEKYLEHYITIADTSIIINKKGNSSLNYAVAPRIQSAMDGVKSFAVDYSTQGVGCYLRNFLVDLLNPGYADISFELGSLYQVKNLFLEKFIGGEFTSIAAINVLSGLQYSLKDLALHKGANAYRLRIVLADGRNIFSNIETVYHFATSSYLVFPNPAKQGQTLQIVSKEPDNLHLLFFNSIGEKILTRNLREQVEIIPLLSLKKGIYFIIILKNGQKEFSGKIIIQ